MSRTPTHRTWPGSTVGRIVGACASLAMGVAAAAGPAGVKLDGTLGGAAMALSGPTYNITQSMGRLAGSNLFFSFQYFNVATGQTALFSTTTGGIDDVISRVTGGYASTIDGTIRLEAASGAPNFFLINPSGVTFTSNAVVDVPAAFYVTTANYVKFSDGNFYANPSVTSTLSTAAPEAFGFLGSTRAPVDVMGALITGGNNGAGAVQLAAGDVTIDGGGNPSGIVTASGDMRPIATGAQWIEVPLSGPVTSNDGTVTIRNGALVGTIGAPAAAAGNIYISAGSLQLDGAGAAGGAEITGEAGATGGGDITIDIAGSASLVNGGFVSTVPNYGAPGGAISLSAGALMIQGGSASASTGIQSSTMTAANSGPVNVQVTGPAAITAGGEVLSVTYGAGKAGDVSVGSGSLTLDGGAAAEPTVIRSDTLAGGDAGAVTVTSSGATTLSNGGQIGSFTAGGGNAGAVKLTTGSLTVNRGTSTVFTGLSSAAEPRSSGNAGALSVTAFGAVKLMSGGQLLSDTGGAAQAGAVTLR